MIQAAGIVVPAHDEEALLPACLASLGRAAADPALAGIPVRIVVVLDACTDASAAVVAAADTGPASLTALPIGARNVGVARAAGFEHLLAEHPADPARHWLATTDADTVVPPGWLAGQLAHAAAGWDAVAGTVEVTDWSGHAAWVQASFDAAYRVWRAGQPHPHVHGANLGVRGSAYLAAGGIRPLALAEDHALVDAVRAAGGRVLAAGDLAVRTSSRTTARASGGFSAYLRDLTPPTGTAPAQ